MVNTCNSFENAIIWKELEWYWHLHHEMRVEPLTEPVENRIEYIMTRKPESERELRLRLLKPVKGRVPPNIVKLWNTYIKSRDASNKAVDVHSRAIRDRVANDVYDKTRSVVIKAWDACNNAYDIYLNEINTNKALSKLHAKECPDCPWDGKTIFQGGLKWIVSRTKYTNMIQ